MSEIGRGDKGGSVRFSHGRSRRCLYIISIAIAVASPPPMQSDATPRFAPRARSAAISVTRMRAPEAPIGWPSAPAPPLTLTFSASEPRSVSRPWPRLQTPKYGGLPGGAGERGGVSHGAISKHIGDGRTYAGRTDQPPRP